MDRTLKLWGGMIVFLGVGLLGALGHASSMLLLPEVLFYLLLLVHTYLSIELFTRIEDRHYDQLIADLLLFVSYVGLGLSLGTPVSFFFFNLCLFVAAPLKYAFLLGRIPHPILLRRKIVIDLSGTLLATVVLGVAIFSSALVAAWLLTILFALASVRYLITHPLYRL
ncbi:MAG TPA: hypothetical protein VN495_02285 [Candidatus Paceibacterota bacterium]|nr:hypothetical protein [Candidatus Paceibacterota bacterium]